MARLPRFAWLLSVFLLCLPDNAGAQDSSAADQRSGAAANQAPPPRARKAPAPRPKRPSTKASRSNADAKKRPNKSKKPQSKAELRGANRREPKKRTKKAAPNEARTPSAAPSANPPQAPPPKRRIVYKDEPLTARELALRESLALTLLSSGPRKLWELRIQNIGNEPVALLQDPRLFWFEVKLPGKARPVDCQLPNSLTPRIGLHTERVTLIPGASWSARIDPQFYCYQDGAQTILVPDAEVSVHYGFPSHTKMVWDKGKLRRLRLKQKGPYAFAPPEQPSDGLKEIAAQPVVLDQQYASWSKAGQLALDKDGRHGGLELLVTKGSDAASPYSASVEVAVRNRSQFSQRLHLRRELVTFVITGPEGETRCEADAALRAVDSQNLTRIAPGKRIAMTVRLSEFCPADTFPRDGFYYVDASLPVFSPDLLEERSEMDGTDSEAVEVPTLQASAPRPLRVLGTEARFRHWEPAPEVIGGSSAAPATPPGSP